MFNLVAPINRTSYGLTSVNLLKELVKQEVVILWPLPSAQLMECDGPTLDEYVYPAVERQRYFEPHLTSVRIWHQFDMGMFPGDGKRIGFPIFEVDKFNTNEKTHLQWLDKIIVTCGWAKRIVEEHFKDMLVSVVPLGVDMTIFNPESRFSPHKQYTTFLNAGKWEYRKGHDILADAFNAAFGPNDRVRLWMLPHNAFIGPTRNFEWEQKYKSTKLGNKIEIFRRMATQHEVASLMHEADCGVFPSRAEGWNLELLEMMACGKPVIATDYSAHTEFCHAGNSLLIPITETEKAEDGVFFDGHGNWAKLGSDQFDCLVEYMRQIHKQKMEGSLQTNTLGIETAQLCSWENSARELLAAI